MVRPARSVGGTLPHDLRLARHADPNHRDHGAADSLIRGIALVSAAIRNSLRLVFARRGAVDGVFAAFCLVPGTAQRALLACIDPYRFGGFLAMRTKILPTIFRPSPHAYGPFSGLCRPGHWRLYAGH